MAKPPTFPTLYDSSLQLSTTKLREWGYLKPNQLKRSSLSWSRNGVKTGSIFISVDTYGKQPSIELKYQFRDEPRKYKIQLVSMPSNLGKGEIWYFLCPVTKKRCRKLYSIGGYFLHREAFNGCMYESQTHSKHYRNFDKQFGGIFKRERLYEELYSKHFKKFYKGKPTKRYIKIMEEMDKITSINYDAFEGELYKV